MYRCQVLGSHSFYSCTFTLLVPPRPAQSFQGLALVPVARPRTRKDCALPVPTQLGGAPCHAMHWGQRTAPKALLSHIWGSDEREWTRYPGPISHPRVPECPPCPGKYGRPWECPSWSSTVHLSQTPGHKWSLVLLIWGA